MNTVFRDIYGVEVDYRDKQLSFAFGVVKWLARGGAAVAAWSDHQVDGAEGVRRLVRYTRARAFRENMPIMPRLVAALNTLDPPNCRCGRKGTRIVGGQTFCSKCGPTAAAQSRLDARFRIREQGSAERAQRWRDIDGRDVKREALRRCSHR